MRTLLVSSSALGIFVFAVPTANAVVVTNVTTGQTIFDSAGFENDTVGSPMSATSAGSWTAYPSDKVITGPAPGPAPGPSSAFAGSKYATTSRQGSVVGGPAANFSSNQTTNGDQLHMEWYAWYPSSGDDNLVIGSRALGRITGGNYLNYDGSGFNVTGLTYTPAVWQKWELDYTIGSADYTVSVADGPGVGIEALSGGSLGRIDFGHNGDDTFYLDGAPPLVFQWANSGSGDWNAAGNWIGPVPNNPGDVANFLGAINAPSTVDSDVPVIVGTIKFDNSNSYLLAGQGTLTMQAAASPPNGSGLVDVVQGTHEINLPLIVASNTTLQVASGATLKISDPVTVNANKSLASSGTGTVTYESTVTLLSNASINLASSQHVTGLTVGDNATVTLVAGVGNNSVLEADSLSISTTGGQVDVTDNKMLFNTQGAGTQTAGIYDGVQGRVQSGYNGGTWDGDGIVTSQSDAQGILTTIGVTTGALARFLGPTDTDTWAGQTINGDSVMVMYTYIGDANLDGIIDGTDYFYIDNSVNTSADGYGNGDFNYDGVVDGTDYFYIDSNIVDQGAPFFAGNEAELLAGVTVVPEPASLATLAIAIGGLLPRRRRI